jgi:hypothetical protein
MSKSQNRSMRNRRQENMTPQKVNNSTIEDLMDSEGDVTSVFTFKRIMIRISMELKEDIQKQVNEFQ